MDSISYLGEIKTNVNLVKERIEQAASKSGRNLSEIKLVAVSKAQPVEKIKAAIESGLTIFGENYPEESEPKILATQNENPQIEWHMIGHLQSRKADLVCKYFSMMHSLDSVYLAEKLNRRLESLNKKLAVLLEVNIGYEESKSGWLANETQEWEILLVDFQRILALDHLSVEGLMVMPPLGDDKEKSRPYFVKLRLLKEFLRKKIPASHWNELSMGTSFDYEVAIEEGATLVRIGEGVFGKRIYTIDRK
jgi:pyridoxal phosphate enzyme (YggS family)